MALPTTLGQAGTGFHGDDAVKTRATLTSLVTLANELKTDFNGVLAKIAADGDTNEQQTITLANATGGTFTLTYSGQTTAAIAYNAAASAVQSALIALSNIGASDVSVSGSAGGPYTVTFQGALAGTDVAELTASATGLQGTDEIQHLTVDATNGDYTLTFSGQTTAAIDHDAVAADVQAALVALSNIAPGDVVVTGGPGDSGGTTPYILTFGGTLSDQNVATITTDATNLTGGASTAVITTPTPGAAPSVTPATSVAGVDSTSDDDYVSTLEVTAASAATPSAHLGNGGSFLHGDDGIATRNIVSSLVTLATALKTKRNLFVTKLDADSRVTDTDYASLHTTAAAAASTVCVEFAQGGAVLHSDDAVKFRTVLQALITLLNEMRTDHNAVNAKLDADGGVGGTDYASLWNISAAAAA